MATGGVVCLTLAAGFAWSQDPGEGTKISEPKPRAPLELGIERKVPAPPAYKGEPGEPEESREKAEVAIYQDLAMHFGTLCDNDGYVVLGTGDTIVQDPNHLVYGGSPQSAQIRLTGDANRAVGVTVAAGSTTGFTLSNFDSDKGVLPLSSLSLDASGNLTLHLGARLQVFASSVNPGSDQQIGYTISVTYE
jgi:hypothetical protein